MQNTLAIIIPAYKPDYLEKTLISLAEQTSRDFTLYIGDDASPANLESIIIPFKERMDIRYHRFPENLGGSNLVAHWERCLLLSEDEEWICLFSDDDLMDKGCVEAFHQCAIDKGVNVLHFDINIIDADGVFIRESAPFPKSLSSAQFFNLLFRRQIDARMPEFIFRKEFLLTNGFIPFNLAWRSDTATVMAAALSNGIQTISGPECKVHWRASSSNISSMENLKIQKNLVNIEFFNWIYDFFHQHSLEMPMNRIYLLKTIVFALEWHGSKGFWKDGLYAIKTLKYSSGIYSLLTLLFIPYRLIYRLFE